MKVLSLSLDPLLFDPTTPPAKRVGGYGGYVDTYTIVLPIAESGEVSLAPNVTVYATGGSNKVIRFFKLYRQASKLLKQQHYDVLTAQDPYFVGLIGYLLSRQFKLGFEIQILGLYHITPIRKFLARILLPKADSMRILSQGLKNRLLSSEFGVKRSDHMHIVPMYTEVSSLGFDTSTMSEEAKQEFNGHVADFHQAYNGRFNLLAVSRLIPVKRHYMQLEAIAALKDEFPQLLLHVVGDGELREKLEKQAKELGIQEHVIFHGAKYHMELGAFFTQCDAFILSSETEGWGMVVIEAATAGLPIVMTDVGCAGSVIINDESGLVVPVGDQEAFTAAVRKLIADPTLLAKLQTGVHTAIAEIPSFDQIASGCAASWQQAARKN